MVTIPWQVRMALGFFYALGGLIDGSIHLGLIVCQMRLQGHYQRRKRGLILERGGLS